MSTFGLFSPYTLRFHSDLYSEPGNALLKRSLVLFDEMAYIAPRKQDQGFIEQAIRSETDYHVGDILNCFRPISDFVDEDFITEISLTVNPETNLWYGPRSNEFADFIKNFLTKKFGFDAHNVKDGREFEILDFYVTALSADFKFLFELSGHDKNLSALYTELHRDAYFATFENKTSTPERVLEKVCSLNYFDFAKLSWRQILELKQSHFLKDFRKFFFKLLDEYDKTQDSLNFEKKLDEYIKTSTFDFLRTNRPKIGYDVATGILGNIPTPFPNPVSIYTSIMGVKKDINIANKFGWLFFIQEAFDKYNRLDGSLD